MDTAQGLNISAVKAESVSMKKKKVKRFSTELGLCRLRCIHQCIESVAVFRPEVFSKCE